MPRVIKLLTPAPCRRRVRVYCRVTAAAPRLVQGSAHSAVHRPIVCMVRLSLVCRGVTIIFLQNCLPKMTINKLQVSFSPFYPGVFGSLTIWNELEALLYYWCIICLLFWSSFICAEHPSFSKLFVPPNKDWWTAYSLISWPPCVHGAVARRASQAHKKCPAVRWLRGVMGGMTG